MSADAPSRRALALCERAEHLIEVGRPADAIPLLTQAAAIDPGSSHPRCLLARAYLLLERHDEARECAEQAIRLQPDGEWGHRLRSIALRRGGLDEESVAAALEAVRLAAQLPEALYNLAKAQLKTNRTRDARATGERLMAIAPERSMAHEVAALVAQQQEDWCSAEVHWRRALALDPQDKTYHNNLGVSLLRQGKTPDAVGSFHEAVRLAPTDDTLRDNLLVAADSHVKGRVGIFSRLLLFGVWIALLAGWWSGYLTSVLAEWGIPLPRVVATAGVAIVSWDALKAAMGQLYTRRELSTLHPVVRGFHAHSERRDFYSRLLGGPVGFLVRVAALFGAAFGFAVIEGRETPLAWAALLVPAGLTILGVRLRRRYGLETTLNKAR